MNNLSATDQALAFDAKALGDLKRSAGADGAQRAGAIRETAKQFEVLFMNMLMKSMRDASPKDGFMNSSSGDMYTGMLDQQLAQKMAARGTGLADVIARQLGAVADPKPAKPKAAGASGPDAATGAASPKGLERMSGTAPGGERTLSVRFAEDSGLRKIGLQRGAQDTHSFAARTAFLVKRGDAAATSGAEATGGIGGARAGDKARDFFDRMKSHASEAAEATGIPAKFMLGQAALESGWGRREIRYPDGSPSHNLFGIKAGANWTGPTVSVTTTEYVNGVPRQQVEKFRAYASYAESFKDYAALITKSPRYAAVAANSNTAEGFAGSLQRAGYATDPRYAEKLSRTINHVIAIAKSKSPNSTNGSGWNQA
jgi:flagellar protein FlgJ